MNDKSMNGLKFFLAKLANGENLAFDEAKAAFLLMMSGEATAAQIGAVLMALRLRGETIDEISGAVEALRERMLSVEVAGETLDIVGTGGDKSGSYNVSTATALVVAGCGVKVAKHGNRALSSRSGSADALKMLGVNIDAPPLRIARAIEQANIGFMFAPLHHPAMRAVGPARVELGIRTIFNILGPLCNPARCRQHLIGVFSPQWLEPVAQSLIKLGSQSFWVVHGDGLDEITTAGETQIVAYDRGKLTHFSLTPEQAGLQRATLQELQGGAPADNAHALSALLAGEKGAYRDIVLINAAAALVIANKTDDLKQGVEMARQSIDSGAARAALEKLIEISNREEASNGRSGQ